MRYMNAAFKWPQEFDDLWASLGLVVLFRPLWTIAMIKLNT